MPLRTKSKTTRLTTIQSKLPHLFPVSNKHPKAVRNADFISLLGRMKNKKKRQKLIDLADKEQIDAISEVIQNALQGTIVLSEVQKQRLRRYKNCMRRLASSRESVGKRKRELQTYSGGFIPLLLKAAIPVIGGLLGGIFNRR